MSDVHRYEVKAYSKVFTTYPMMLTYDILGQGLVMKT